MGGEQKERNKFLLVWQNITTREEEEEESSNSENEVRDESVKAWPRFLVVEVAVSLSPFAIAKGFKTFLLLVFLQSTACALDNSSSSSPTRKPWRLYADDCLIKVTAHRSLNSSIRCPDLTVMSEVDIRSKMASQGVFAVQRVSLEKDGKSVTTNTLFQTTLCFAQNN